MATLRTRLQALEQHQTLKPIACAFDSVEAAQAAGIRGGWLHIGATMDFEQWVTAARVQQAALCGVTHGNA